MKLTKKKIAIATKNSLKDIGYIELKDSITVADVLFGKRIENGYYLTLGFTLSRYFESMFTASYYLSKTTRWGAVWDDFPREAYKRIGAFLTPEERNMLLDKDQTTEGIIDAWWNGNDKLGVSHFLKAVILTEQRFLEQPFLFNKIDNSLVIGELSEYCQSVIKEVSSKKPEDKMYKYIPEKSIDEIPMNWFKAAEKVIREKGGILNANTVKSLAADAWRQSYLG